MRLLTLLARECLTGVPDSVGNCAVLNSEVNGFLFQIFLVHGPIHMLRLSMRAGFLVLGFTQSASFKPSTEREDWGGS